MKKAAATAPHDAGPSITEGLVRLIRSKPVSQPDYEAAALFTLDAVANILAGRNSEPGRVLLNWWQARATNEAPEPFHGWRF